MDHAPRNEQPFDQRARDTSLGALADVIEATREILGAKLVAFIGHATRTETVRAWIDGSTVVDRETERRLRAACYAATLLHEREGSATIQSWFLGMNPELDDEPPAELLNNQNLDDSIERVERAARHFWVNG